MRLKELKDREKINVEKYNKTEIENKKLESEMRKLKEKTAEELQKKTKDFAAKSA